MLEKNTFFVTDAKGNDIECLVLFTHYDEKFEKHYVVYTPVKQSFGPTQVYAMIYNPDKDGNVTDFSPIETDEEWDMIEQKLEELKNSIDSN